MTDDDGSVRAGSLSDRSPTLPAPKERVTGVNGWRLSLLLVITFAAVAGADDGWSVALHDRFTPRVKLGPDWMVLRGDWHIGAGGGLRTDPAFTGRKHLACEAPLLDRDVRVTFEVTVDEGGTCGLLLQAGDMGWGAGGPDDRVGVELQAGATPVESGPIHCVGVTAGQRVQVRMLLLGGQFSADAAGRAVASGDVPRGRNPLAAGLQITATGGVTVHSVLLETRAMAAPPVRPLVYDAATNRRATVDAGAFVDADQPDAGLQGAIDSLPPAGGVVLLPPGTFRLRRYLEVPGGVTVAGAGDKTTLVLAPVGGWRVQQVTSRAGGTEVLLPAGHDLKPGDAVGPWGIGDRNRILVMAVDGRHVTLNKPWRHLEIHRFFPAVCSYQSLTALRATSRA